MLLKRASSINHEQETKKLLLFYVQQFVPLLEVSLGHAWIASFHLYYTQGHDGQPMERHKAK
jgi:hypothetical protein